MSYPYIIQNDNITVVVDNKPYTVNESHVGYKKLLNAIKQEDWDTVQAVVDPKKVVLDYGEGNFSIQGEVFYWQQYRIDTSLTKRIIAMIADDFPVHPLLNFMSNLMDNPSKQAVEELYTFLNCNSLPITPDGCFLAYKRVRGNYRDVYSDTVTNKPAVYHTDEDREELKQYMSTNPEVEVQVVDNETVVSMLRNRVDDIRDNHCSTGLHFCSREYLNYFGGERIVIVKINPRDVVSIPTDYNYAKGRTCRYTVVDEIDKDKADEAFELSVQEAAQRNASMISIEDIQKVLDLAKEAASLN